MTGLEFLSAAGAAAGKEQLKVLIKDVYEKSSAASQGLFRKWKNEREIGRLYSQIAKIRMVKTLWQIDKAVESCDLLLRFARVFRKEPSAGSITCRFRHRQKHID